MWYAALYRECLAGAQIIFPESGRGLGHVTPTILGSTVGYPSDSLASCFKRYKTALKIQGFYQITVPISQSSKLRLQLMFKVSSLFMSACLKTSCEFLVRFPALIPAPQLHQHFEQRASAGFMIDSSGLSVIIFSRSFKDDRDKFLLGNSLAL